MEVLTNAASTAATTVSNLIYGQPAKANETTGNETAGKEPLSGQQGKGTVNEPFDQGNAENPVDPSSKSNTAVTSASTSSTADDYLKLNPAMGKPAATESLAASSAGKTSSSSAMETGPTDKTGVTNNNYKETPFEPIELLGAPGAGPSAPEYTPAKPETNPTSSTSDTPSHHHSVDAAKDSSTTETKHDSSAPKTESVDPGIDTVLNTGSSSKAEHSVDDKEVENPHAKMAGKTVRHTDASKSGEGGEPSYLVADSSEARSESSKQTAPTSSTPADEKSGKKKSNFKDKLKDKLHIGSKDK